MKHSKNILLLSLLVLAMGACNPTQLPNQLTSTPFTITSTPVPLEFASPTPLPPTPRPPPLDVPVVAAPVLLRIDFRNSDDGWGIAANDGGKILRTLDGGTNWLNVTPPDLTGIGYSTSMSLLDNHIAWVLVPNMDFYTGRLYRTSDGGLTWTSADVPFGGARIQFLDANTGRALADRGAGLGSNSVEMFQTADGGATWSSVFHNDPTRSNSNDSLPLSGIKNGITYLDANTGWVTGSRPVGGEVYLFVTLDGGASWAAQSIPLPAGYESFQTMPQAPFFFERDGFLPLMITLPDRTELTFYLTEDGGASWTVVYTLLPTHYTAGAGTVGTSLISQPMAHNPGATFLPTLTLVSDCHRWNLWPDLTVNSPDGLSVVWTIPGTHNSIKPPTTARPGSH
jgi:photosystem II stability/assembly factor-like uncharacterized protein